MEKIKTHIENYGSMIIVLFFLILVIALNALLSDRGGKQEINTKIEIDYSQQAIST